MTTFQFFKNHCGKCLATLALLLASTQVTFAAGGSDGVWKGDSLKLDVKQSGNTVAGKIQIGDASFDIRDGKSTPAGDFLSFTTVQNVQMTDATHSESLPKPQKFSYRAILTGDKLHVTISSSNGKGASVNFDLARSN